MRILLTGASGFVGAHLARRLHGEGHELFVLPSPRFRPRRLEGVGYTVVTDAGEARAEVVYHLASTPLSEEIAEATHESVIVGGTRRLLQELLRTGHRPPRRLIMTGSAAEYGSGHDWREDDIPRPDTAFGRFKRMAAELACAAGAGIASVHLRIFTPFGEGEAPGRLVPSIARAVESGPATATVKLATNGQQTRDYFHVAALIEALVAAARRPLEPGVAINICSGTPRRVIDVARRVAQIAGCAPGFRVEPGEKAVAYLAESSGNNERAARLLGWRPRPGFDEGLCRAVEAAFKESRAA